MGRGPRWALYLIVRAFPAGEDTPGSSRHKNGRCGDNDKDKIREIV